MERCSSSELGKILPQLIDMTCDYERIKHSRRARGMLLLPNCSVLLSISDIIIVLNSFTACIQISLASKGALAYGSRKDF